MIMKITEKKEIMRLFDAGDFESRKKAVSMLYEGFSGKYLMVIKRMFKRNKYDVYMYSPEEILQDVFLYLLSKKTKPSSASTISAWLRAYVLTEIRDDKGNLFQKVKRNVEWNDFSSLH